MLLLRLAQPLTAIGGPRFDLYLYVISLVELQPPRSNEFEKFQTAL